jgi:hypothetical protein
LFFSVNGFGISSIHSQGNAADSMEKPLVWKN